MTSIEIPASVTYIGDWAFYQCTSLASITIYAPSLTTYGYNTFNYNADGRKIYVFSDCVETYRAHAGNLSVDENDILPIEGIALAANAHDGNYWTTFFCGLEGFKINDEENAYAYTAEYDAVNARLTLHKLGKVIPKGTAVIIVGEDNTISMTASDESATVPTNNLHGVNVRTLTSTLGTGTFYVLGKQDDDLGFLKYTGDYLPARKAYLLLDGGTALAKGLTMVFDDEATAIASMSDVRGQMSDVWYTIDGRRLSGKTTTKGLYIVNGKKVYIP